MYYRVYARFEGEKRFGALGNVGNGVDKVSNLIHAYIYASIEDAQKLVDFCKEQVPTCEFEIRKVQ